MKGINSDADLKKSYSTLTADARAAFETLSIVRQADDIPDKGTSPLGLPLRILDQWVG